MGSNDFGGGVSNGLIGVVAYEHNYKNVQAYKAYFMIGDAMVCLGSNIKSTNTSEIITSVNQCFLKGIVTVSHGETIETMTEKTSNNYNDLKWVYHDNVGYIFPKNANNTVKNEMQTGSWSLINGIGNTSPVENYIFSLWISHGTTPKNGEYQYMVVPDKTIENFKEYAQNHGFVIVRNDNKVQAVRNDKNNKMGIVFHSGETIDLGNGLIVTSTKPALVLLEQTGENYNLSVADPKYCETTIQLTLNKQLSGANAVVTGNNTTITINLPTGDYKGSSVTNNYTLSTGSWANGVYLVKLENAASQYLYMKNKLNESDRFPKTYNKYVDRLQTSGSDWWCSGFYPGTLFYLYEETGKQELFDEGVRMLTLLEKEQFNVNTHDIGFMMYCSYGNADRISPCPAYRETLINSAKSLITRFNPKVGCIKSHNRGENDFVVIIDNMMNLELLFRATQITGDSIYHRIAVAHANTTLKNHFRSDGSLYHGINYHPETGEVVYYQAGQGYSEQSVWARGQAWGIYGYTMAYRYTKDQRYLNTAIELVNLVINHPNMPSDLIPYWDFNAPEIPNTLRDASSAAIICSGLLELAQYIDQPMSSKYINDARTIISTLSSPEYTADQETNGGFILKHSVGNVSSMTELDVPLTYADYYYIEALKRYKALQKK
ncbi:Unsaturated glucuronyl hydrolase [termite gut metagenome]|uniref:Unsaturated glucuronyl hydrolase n=1 Tax=termite gut metagenome TaxID=433724 RepID=A0A5J4R6N8_9ZZZZ